MNFQQSAPVSYPQKLRIGIDGRPLQGNRRGVGRYVFELCRELDKCLPNAQFFVYSPVSVEMPVLSDRWILRTALPMFSKSRLLWLKLVGGFLCRKDYLNVFWGTNIFLPRLPYTVKKVVTVHDLVFRIVPETLPTAHLWGNRLFFIKDVQKADIVLANSEGTSERLWDLVGRRAAVIHPAVGKAFRPKTDSQIETCLKIYGISYPYILNVAAWEPRKNLELLVKTFINIKNRGLLPYHKLVLVGDKGWKYKNLEAQVNNYGGNYIVSLGYVPNEHLPSLYSGADVFVFPSIYEGFGIPVLEARACGTQIVTSDIAELRDAGGSDAIYIEPTERGIRNGILAALNQAPRQREPISLPTWELSAMLLADALCSERQSIR